MYYGFTNILCSISTSCIGVFLFNSQVQQATRKNLEELELMATSIEPRDLRLYRSYNCHRYRHKKCNNPNCECECGCQKKFL